MNLPKIQYEGHMNMHLSVLIQEVHGEYSMPEMPGVTVRHVWHGSDVEDYIESLKDHLNISTEEALVKAFDANIKAHSSEANGAGVAYDTEDDYLHHSNILWITFWAGYTREALEQLIQSYMQTLEGLVEKAMEESSGDDDYFDYMPSYVDQYRQLCEYFGDPFIDNYNEMIAAFLAKPENEDNNIYVEQITKP